MTRTRIKFCGIRSAADAMLAAAAGADAVGMILHAPSRRLIDLTTAKEIVDVLPPYVCPVGVFVDASADHVNSVAAKLTLTTAQLHGDETPAVVAECRARVIKAIKVDAHIDLALAPWRTALANGTCPNLIALLLESPVAGQPGGTGVVNDFEKIAALIAAGTFDGLPPLILSGGLSPQNVAAAVSRIRPYAADVSSGIESIFGTKSFEKMQNFTSAVANAAK